MHLAIVVVGFRNPEDVCRCAGALARSTHQDFELIVCENGGPSAVEALRQALPATLPGGQSVRLLEAPRNLGYAGGVNLGMSKTRRADAWWVLNPDTLPDPDALAALVERLQGGDCDMAGGILYREDGIIQSHGGRWRPWMARAEAIGHGRPLSDPLPASEVEPLLSYVSGASMLVGRRFFETVGPMREDYFLYCEEIEWCLRGSDAGMRLGFTSAARVLHHQGSTTGSATAIRNRARLPIYLDERNKLLVTRDCFPARLAVAAMAALAFIALRFAARGAWTQTGYALRGWSAGLRGLRESDADRLVNHSDKRP